MTTPADTPKRRRRRIHVGRRFGRWTVVAPAGHRATSTGPKRLWLCRCACGTERVQRRDRLTDGRTRSCGCAAWGDGATSRPEYRAWKNLKRRAKARGEKIQRGWRSFNRFLSDLGPRPGPGWRLCRTRREWGWFRVNVRWRAPRDGLAVVPEVPCAVPFEEPDKAIWAEV